MSEDKAKMVPALRFPGFESNWWRKPLQKLSSKPISYGIVQTGDRVDGGVKCVRVVDLTKAKIIPEELITTSEEISRSYKKTILVEGELMVALRGEIGRTAIVPKWLEGSNLTRGIARIAPKPSEAHPEFLLLALSSDEGKTEFQKQVNGSALKEIPIGGLNKIEVQLTTLPEQRKIADFLTAVDRRIQQLSQKKALLEDYKKGVLQQLFTQALRFKDDDGNDFPDWEDTLFGELGKFIGGGTPSKTNKSFWSGSIPWISSSDLSQESIVHLKVSRFITEDAILKSATKLVPRNTVLIVSRVGVGKIAVAPTELCTSQDFTSLVPRTANPYFLAYFLKASVMQLLSFNQGTSIQGFTKEDISELKMGVPSLTEQAKIANLLSALDRKIEAVASQITHTQTFKKGLLQQMFV